MFVGFRTAGRRIGVLAAAVLLGTSLGLLIAGPRISRADLLITGGADKKVKLWLVPDGMLVAGKDVHDGAVTALAVSVDGSMVATGGADKKIKIVGLKGDKRGKIIAAIDAAHDGDVTALAFSKDGKKLYSGGADKKVKSWNVADGKSLPALPALASPVVGIYVVSGYIIYGGADGKVKVLDTDLDPVIDVPTEHVGGMTAMAGSSALGLLCTGGADGKLKYFGTDQSHGDFTGEQGSPIKAIAILAAVHKVVTGGKDGKIKIWDSEKHTLLKTIDDAHKGGVNVLTASPDGKTIVSGGADNKVKLWNSADGAALKTIDAHDAPVTVAVYLDPKLTEMF